MLFNSLAFAIFLPVVFLVHWALPHRYRWMLLLAASLYFYMSWNPALIFLILLTTGVSWASALLIERSSDAEKKKLWMLLGVGVSLASLLFFKYFNFLSESVVGVLRLFSLPVNDFTLRIILPVGISFYTFQTLSYVIDVYRGNTTAEKHFGNYALYISFFPQLVAGPIERADSLLPQFKKERSFDYATVTYGLRVMAWGFFKKMVIADKLSVYVDNVYNNVGAYPGGAFVLASLLFAVQIYCDFSGYSDIAIGSANLLGIKLTRNFSSPYFSKSFKEFWDRWHISLSTWFRDYVYIPLGGNRVKYGRYLLNLFAVFLISGLWHGADWTFVIWGALHGAYRVAETLLGRLRKGAKPKRGRLVNLAALAVTFALTTLAWVFFRANSLPDALHIFQSAFVGIGNPIQYLRDAWTSMSIGKMMLLFIVPPVLLLGVVDFRQLKGDVFADMAGWTVVRRWTIYVLFLVFALAFYTPMRQASPFIYFQF